MEGGTFEDDGAGHLIHKSGSDNYSQLTIDYELGEINVWRASNYTTASASASYQPAVAITGAAVSGAIPISNQNRGFNYTLDMAEAKPRPGTLVVSYIALGKWQDLREKRNSIIAIRKSLMHDSRRHYDDKKSNGYYDFTDDILLLIPAYIFKKTVEGQWH